jgi:hypothetical protein
MARQPGPAINGAQPPTPVGVLTKTIIPAPVTRWILHARLRQRWLNDVVFVGENFVHVRHVGFQGHLEPVVTKNDFDASIRAAKVLSLEPEPAKDDYFVKKEDGSSSESAAVVPHDILVLTLDTNDVLFLYLATDEGGALIFRQQACPMPEFDSILFQPGQHLAIDPLSRAMAVAAHEREVVIYSAKRKESIERQIRTADPNWCPVSAQRPLQVDGVIQHIDFLIPPSDDRDHVILLLIVIDERTTKAVWIDWYYTSDLHHAEVHQYPLSDARTVANTLIPFRDAAFMLTTGSSAAIWSDILSGAPESREFDLDGEPKEPGSSPRQPIWCSWCRPRRIRASRADNDYVYLVREDGLVHLLNVMEPRQMTSSSAGHFNCHVDTGFASLGGADEPDILAVAGDMSTGSVVSIGLWSSAKRISSMSYSETMEMVLIETISNWASVTDMVSLTTRHAHGKSGRSYASRPSVFVTSGRQPYGTITELRTGLEARVSVYYELSDLQSIKDVWAAPLLVDGSALVLMSDPMTTRVLKISGGESLEAEELDGSTCSALDLDHETLSAASTREGRIIQVTTQAIIATSTLESNFEDTWSNVRGEGVSILGAAISAEREFVVTIERGDAYNLCCVSLGVDEEDHSGSTLQLSHESTAPTAVATTAIASTHAVLVAMSDATLRLFDVSDGSIREVGQSSLPGTQDMAAACDYMVFLRSPKGNDRLFVAGLRDGRIFTQVIQASETKPPTLGQSCIRDFGTSTVKLVQLPGHPSAAFAMSGSDTCLLTWDGVNALSLDIKNVWISDKQRPALAQGAIVAATQMPSSEHLSCEDVANAMVFISGNEFLLADIQPNATTVPRQLPVSGTPNRLIYAERQRQRCFVTASMRTGVRSFSAPSGLSEVKRQIWPVIDFTPPGSTEPACTYDMQPGERVFALLEWNYKGHDERSYSFILVGGSYRRKNNNIGGCIRFLQISRESTEVNDGHLEKFEAPVYALALFDDLTYVVSYGSVLVLFRFQEERRKWERCCEPFLLASPGTFITVEGPFILVSTMEDSLMTLRFGEGSAEDGEPAARLVLVHTEPRAETAVSHLGLDLSTRSSTESQPDRLALVSTKDRRIIGLTSASPAHMAHRQSSAASILFEARLPRSITRLRQSDIRPKWKAAPPEDVIIDNVIGCCPDGALMGIAIINEKLWKRLSWLQRLCEWHQDLCPHTHVTPPYTASDDVGYAREERPMPIGLSSEGDADVLLRTNVPRESDRHINGDILVRILERGGGELLNKMIQDAAEKDDRVGEWMTNHMDEELAAVDEIISILRRVLDCWI